MSVCEYMRILYCRENVLQFVGNRCCLLLSDYYHWLNCDVVRSIRHNEYNIYILMGERKHTNLLQSFFIKDIKRFLAAWAFLHWGLSENTHTKTEKRQKEGWVCFHKRHAFTILFDFKYAHVTKKIHFVHVTSINVCKIKSWIPLANKHGMKPKIGKDVNKLK